MKKYVLDSNIFIQAHRMHYPFDVVPGFWNKIIHLSQSGITLSIDKVKIELCDNSNDELSKWCTSNLNPVFFAHTEACLDTYIEITQWANSNHNYTFGAKEEFLSTDLADPWLIAFAKKYNYTIVTHEVSQPSRKNKIKIPEPCSHFNVRYINLIDMMRELGETF